MSQDKKIKYLPGDILVAPNDSSGEEDIIFLEHVQDEHWSSDIFYMKIKKKTTDELFFLPTIFAEKYYINISGIARARDEKIDVILLNN